MQRARKRASSFPFVHQHSEVGLVTAEGAVQTAGINIRMEMNVIKYILKNTFEGL